MNGEDEAEGLRDAAEFRHDARQHRLVVDIGGAVQRHQTEAVPGQAKFPGGRIDFDAVAYELVAIDHDVADADDAIGRDTLGAQIVVGVLRRGPQQIGDRIGDDPVDFLGHGAVAAAQAGLEMGERQAELLCDQTASQRRVDVADHDDPVGRRRAAEALIGNHHAAGLLGVAAAADLEIVVRRRQSEIGEERIRHVGVVVLAGMDDDRRGPVARRGERVIERRDLHEIRPRRRDEMDFLDWQSRRPSEAPIGDAGGDEGAVDDRFHIDEDAARREGRERRCKAVLAKAAMRHRENEPVELA